MSYNFNQFKTKTKEIGEWLSREFASIRTGRATPALLDSVQVESYGARVPLKQVSAIAVEDVRSLRISVWDKTQLKAVESAIMSANLGLSVAGASDGSGLRVTFPELTADKRALLAKLAHDRTEEAKVSLRKEREKVWNDIQEKEEAKELSEDEKFRLKDELQKIVAEENEKLEKLKAKKDAEIMN
ncbi:ribosome recycling factor [Candidatus Nomurabacteria bacterium]|nr:ribosome recycling factor [Candidatus Nomurabacteria bacterium]